MNRSRKIDRHYNWVKGHVLRTLALGSNLHRTTFLIGIVCQSGTGCSRELIDPSTTRYFIYVKKKTNTDYLPLILGYRCLLEIGVTFEAPPSAVSAVPNLVIRKKLERRFVLARGIGLDHSKQDVLKQYPRLLHFLSKKLVMTAEPDYATVPCVKLGLSLADVRRGCRRVQYLCQWPL